MARRKGGGKKGKGGGIKSQMMNAMKVKAKSRGKTR